MPDANSRAKSITNQALKRTDAAVRTGYLDGACGDDVDLRRHVEAMLATIGTGGRSPADVPTALPDIMSTSDLDASRTLGPETDLRSRETLGELPPGSTRTEAEKSRPGAVLDGSLVGQVVAGRYRLIGALGEGGMGIVYRAEQTQPVRRTVALKLIRVGRDSRAVLARFDAERQALALMDHPNIARVYDGGTTAAGQPFFAMELIDGTPITDYCDEKRLPLGARLELFVAVCQAVQHAHQKGIIHRDLKPSNVLVTEVDGRPTPKVIDFGVAKAIEFSLTDMSLADTGAIVGTPTYMSPEQADPSSMDIDTRTDVYALGVILYELLAGSPPIDAKAFKKGAFLEMLRMVREVDPPSPSTRLSKADDLPSIAATRGLEPAQLRRSLKGDLDWIVMKALEKDRNRRYETANGFAADVLRHLATEPVLAAPPSRAYRMRKFVRKHRGAVAAAGLVVVTLLAGIVGTSFGLIAAEAQRREAERNLAFATRGNEILGSIFAGVDPKANYATAAELSGALRDGLKKAVRELDGAAIGDPLVVAAMQVRLGNSLTALRETSAAIEVLSAALDTRKKKLGPDHPDTLASVNNLAVAYEIAGKPELAIPLHKETLELRKIRLGPDHLDTLSSMNNLATAYKSAGKPELAIPLHKETLERRKIRLGPDHPDTLSSMNNLAVAYDSAGKLDLAIPLQKETLELRKIKLGSDHPDTLSSMNNLAVAYENAGKLDLVIPLQTETLELKKVKFGLNHPDTLSSMNNLGWSLRLAGKLDQAIPLLKETLKLRKTKLGAEHPDTLGTMSNLASAYSAVGDLNLAIQLAEEHLQLNKANRGPDHPDTIDSMMNLAVYYESVGKLDLAIQLAEEVFQLNKAKRGPDHPLTLVSMHNLALDYMLDGKLDVAIPRLEATFKSMKTKLGPDHYYTLDCTNSLATAYRLAGKLDLAVPLYEESLKLRKAKLGPDHPATLDTLRSLGHSLLLSRDFTRSESLLRECLAINEKVGPDDWQTFDVQSLLGGALLGQKKYRDAEPYLRRGYEGMQQRKKDIYFPDRFSLPEAIDRLIDLMTATNRPDEVKKWQAERAKYPPAATPPPQKTT